MVPATQLEVGEGVSKEPVCLGGDQYNDKTPDSSSLCYCELQQSSISPASVQTVQDCQDLTLGNEDRLCRLFKIFC